jgi:RHS repeat-associated protein
VFDFEYDDEGNMVAKEEIASGERIEYEWDHRNRLIRIVFKDEYDAVVQVVEQTYDYQNRWVRSQIDADGDEDFDSERFFAYDGNQIVLDFAGDAASDLSHRYLWGPAVDQILADESVDSLAAAGDVLWPLTDHLGTTRDLAEYDSIENETSIASHRIFDSFGNLVSETNGSVTILFGFTARPFDVASGLQWNLNRWYISTLGVWMSEDPIGFKGDPSNLSRYVLNSPLDGTDPTGLDRYITQMTVVGGMHTGVAVDLWKKQGDGTYKKVGIKTFHFKADTSAYCYTNLLLSTLYGRGKVITYNGLVLGDKYITFSSYPEEDIAMLEYLEEQAANPSFYSAMAHNCVFWSVNAVNVGIDNSILRPDEEFEQKLPAADIGGPESPGDEFEMRLPAAEIGGPESPGH